MERELPAALPGLRAVSRGKKCIMQSLRRTINLYKNYRDLECVCYCIRTAQKASLCGQAAAGVPRSGDLQVKIGSEMQRIEYRSDFSPNARTRACCPRCGRAPRFLLVPSRRAARPQEPVVRCFPAVPKRGWALPEQNGPCDVCSGKPGRVLGMLAGKVAATDG